MRYVCDTFAMRLRISLKYNYLQCISRGKKCLIWAENSEKCLCFYRENIVRKIANNRKIFLAIFCDAFAIVLRCICDTIAINSICTVYNLCCVSMGWDCVDSRWPKVLLGQLCGHLPVICRFLMQNGITELLVSYRFGCKLGCKFGCKFGCKLWAGIFLCENRRVVCPAVTK